MQFFIYYVFWPFIAGFGFICTGILAPESMWYFLIAWYLPWIAWPVGKYRRRHMGVAVAQLEAETKEAGQPLYLKLLALILGPVLCMVLAAMSGTGLAPIYVENVLGVDIVARVKENQARVELNRSQEPSEVSPEAGSE